jgi:hypothetical protein
LKCNIKIGSILGLLLNDTVSIESIYCIRMGLKIKDLRA